MPHVAQLTNTNSQHVPCKYNSESSSQISSREGKVEARRQIPAEKNHPALVLLFGKSFKISPHLSRLAMDFTSGLTQHSREHINLEGTHAAGTYRAKPGFFSHSPGAEMAAQLITTSTGPRASKQSCRPSPDTRSTCEPQIHSAKPQIHP